jgi:hypothetical protein
MTALRGRTGNRLGEGIRQELSERMTKGVALMKLKAVIHPAEQGVFWA